MANIDKSYIDLGAHRPIA